jgi:hypothetical protein
VNQVTLGADRRARVLGWEGSVAPNVVLRALGGGAQSGAEWNPSVALNLRRGGRALNALASVLVQDREDVVASDAHVTTLGLNYSQPVRANSLGLESNYTRQSFDPGNRTDAYQVVAFYRIAFDKPGAKIEQVDFTTKPPGEAPQAQLMAGREPIRPGTLDLVGDLPLGGRAGDVRAALEAGGFGGGVAQGASSHVYEARPFPEFAQRQRLVLTEERGALRTAAVIVELDDLGSRVSFAQLYEGLRKSLSDRYGSPSATFETGDLTDAIALDVNNNRLVRVTEWKTASGILRLGIPRRLDGRVRIEAQHARSFPSPRETFWSIEEVR